MKVEGLDATVSREEAIAKIAELDKEDDELETKRRDHEMAARRCEEQLRQVRVLRKRLAVALASDLGLVLKGEELKTRARPREGGTMDEQEKTTTNNRSA